MKKYLLILGAVSLIIVGLSSSAFSYSFGMESFSTYKNCTYTYGSNDGSFNLLQGEYIGTAYDANDDEATLGAFLSWAGWSDPVVTFFGKDETNDILIPYTQTCGGERISGTWEVAGSNPAVVEFIIIKGGHNFSVHQYDPAVSSGVWNIGYLADAGGSGSPATISHLSAYNAASPVPEPSTIILLGLGLLGLVGGSKLRKKS